jgi:hypothetical protein
MASARTDKAPIGFEAIHKILGRAMRVLEDPTAWPEHPHRGGPLPILGSLAQLRVCIAIVEHAMTIWPIPFGEQPTALDYARRAAGGERIPRAELEKIKGWGGPSGQTAQTMVKAAVNYLYAAASARNSIGTHVENAAAGLVLNLRPKKLEREGLEAIDQIIMKIELGLALDERTIAPSAEVTGVIARPKGCTLARLGDGRFGLLVRLKGR